MDFLRNMVEPIRAMQIRPVLDQIITLGIDFRAIDAEVNLYLKISVIAIVFLSLYIADPLSSVDKDDPHFGIDHMERIDCRNRSESPVVVVLSESMEPGFRRGDILFLHMNKDPVRTGDIIVFNIEGRDIPIVHRVIKVHERHDTAEFDVLTKGDNNRGDDRMGMLYANGQLWLQRQHIIGRAVGYLPYAGWLTIAMTEKPILKYLLIGVLGLLVVASRE